MFSLTKSTLPLLLSLLPAVALAQGTPYTWQVTNLQAFDLPQDPAHQTDIEPAFHYINFDITDKQQSSTFSCATSWPGRNLPSSLMQCAPVGGYTGQGPLSFAVEGFFSSAAGGFELAVVEEVNSAGAVSQYNGSIAASNGVKGGTCTYTPLQAHPFVTFPSCSWPPFDVDATKVN